MNISTEWWERTVILIKRNISVSDVSVRRDGRSANSPTDTGIFALLSANAQTNTGTTGSDKHTVIHLLLLPQLTCLYFKASHMSTGWCVVEY